MRSFATIRAGIDSEGAGLRLQLQSGCGQPQSGQTGPIPVEKTSLAFTRLARSGFYVDLQERRRPAASEAAAAVAGVVVADHVEDVITRLAERRRGRRF